MLSEWRVSARKRLTDCGTGRQEVVYDAHSGLRCLGERRYPGAVTDSDIDTADRAPGSAYREDGADVTPLERLQFPEVRHSSKNF